MATFRKRGAGWRAEVARKGIRQSATFATKSEAIAWAANTEADIIDHRHQTIPNKTLGDLLDRYCTEVSTHKRGFRWEYIRIQKLKRDAIARIKLADLDATHFADWRDRMLRVMSASSVRREWNLFNPALNIAVKEWRWLPTNPLSDVRRPKPTKARTRRISSEEQAALIGAMGYRREDRPQTATARTAAAFLFAIETAMRASEICGLKIVDVDLRARTAHLPKTKNGHARTVPLSTEAVRIIKQLRPEGAAVFDLTPATIDALFRKAKIKAGIDDLHFHDTRREALTRLSKKLTVMELAKMSGHRDLRILLNVYYEPTAEELAKKLG